MEIIGVRYFGYILNVFLTQSGFGPKPLWQRYLRHGKLCPYYGSLPGSFYLSDLGPLSGLFLSLSCQKAGAERMFFVLTLPGTSWQRVLELIVPLFRGQRSF